MLSAQHHQDPAESKQQQQELQLIILGHSFLCAVSVVTVVLPHPLLHSIVTLCQPGVETERSSPYIDSSLLAPVALENINCIVLPRPEE